jgi:type I restriction enzyme, S subunit
VSAWRTIRLADVAKVGAGNSAPQDKTLFEGGTYPFFRTADVGRVKVGEMRAAQDHLNERGIKGLKLHPAGTVLIPKSGASTFLDHRVIMTVNGYVSSHLATLYANEDVLDRRYLFWVLQTISARDVSTDTSYPTLSLAQISEIPIPHPPLDEQRRIVKMLDEAFAAVATATANVEKNLGNARDLLDTYLTASFNLLSDISPRKTIGEIAAVKGGKRVPKGYKLEVDPTPYPYLTVSDFSDEGSIEPTGIRYVSGAVHAQIKRYVIRSCDLYVSIAGTIGRTGIVPDYLDGAQLTENACRLVFDDGVSNRYVYYFTLSRSFKDQAVAQTRTTAQPKLALSRLEQIQLPVPSLVEQNLWVEKFREVTEEVRSLTGIYGNQLKQHRMLKQSLLDRAFSGELTEREPVAA